MSTLVAEWTQPFDEPAARTMYLSPFCKAELENLPAEKQTNTYLY